MTRRWPRRYASRRSGVVFGRSRSFITPQAVGLNPTRSCRQLIAKHQEESAYQVAMVYAARGETDLAFAWLERAYVQRDAGLSEMKPDPLLRSLHADPRWDGFLRKMGFPD